MIVRSRRYFPPLFFLLGEQFDYFIMDTKPFDLLLKNIESGFCDHKVLRMEGNFTIIFSKKVLDK